MMGAPHAMLPLLTAQLIVLHHGACCSSPRSKRSSADQPGYFFARTELAKAN